ncbi:MAG TPA: nuclear transport factor 2 family protein [Pyrinomonadaceae bacterium]|nr:nuclear transport factor 2 family protein [Pyrinomonadaceae bacterium]
MKRLFIIAGLIVLSSSFALVWSASRRAADDAAIVNNEKQIIQTLTKKDASGFKSLIADDAILMGSSGRISIADAIKFLFSPDYSFGGATVEDPQVKMVDANSALLTYKSTGTETYKGQSHTSTAYCTTLWVKRGAKWVAVFHQESEMKPAGASQ